MTHICSRNGWQWAAPTRMSLKPSHKILVLYLCVAAWVAWANQVSVCFDSRALLLLPAARNPIHNYLQLPRTGRPAGCAPACHDRIGSDEQTSHNNSTHSVMIRDAIPHDSRIRIREKHFKKSGQMLTRLSPGPADLFDLFFLIFFPCGFLNCRFESLDGVAGGTFSRSFATTTTAKSSLKVYYKEIRKKCKKRMVCALVKMADVSTHTPVAVYCII